jgi:signal transduction histidine kinase/ActR/RegA family two-component response regulator
VSAGIADDDAPMRDTQRALLPLRLVLALAVIVPLLTFAVAGWNLYRTALADAQLRVDSAARVGEEQALKIFETSHALLARVIDQMGDDSEDTLLARQAAFHEQLKRMVVGLTQLQGIFVVGPSGRMIATNRLYPAPRDIDYSDRPYFRHHQGGGAQPYMSPLLTSRSTGEPFFDMNVRRSLGDGSFGGAVSISLAPGYFANFYASLARGAPGLHMALVHGDGSTLVHWPQGAATAPRADGNAVQSARPLAPYSMRVVAWISHDDAVAPAYREMALLAGFGFPIAAALLTITWLALRRTRSALEAAERLRTETALRERVEQALQQAQKLEAMGRLTGGVAHDFNNLLMVVGNNLFLHQRQHPALADSRPLAAIARAVDTGAKLTRQLLSFTRHQPQRPVRVLLQQKLPGLLGLLTPAVGGAVELALQVDADTAAIEVDDAELDLALLNLAINARDAMPQGGRLEIRAGNAAQAPALPGVAGPFVGPFVHIEACDNGPGIAPEILGRVFEPFFTTKPVGHGTGLGLAQVYGFCTRAGGTAVIDSAPGQGTTVRLLLPAAQTPAPPLQRAAEAEPDGLTGLRVLIVEDNPDVAAATQSVLQTLGCATQGAVGADEALRRLRHDAAAFDLVLTDIVMPGTMDGIGLALSVRSICSWLPVVVMSGYSTSMDKAAALGIEVLAKPCTPQALSQAIRRALRRSAAELASP